MKANTQTAHNSINAQQKRTRMMTAIFLGALAGVLMGILGMAVGALGSNLLSLFMDTAVLKLPGMSMAAITFFAFFFLGSIAASYFIWRKIH